MLRLLRRFLLEAIRARLRDRIAKSRRAHCEQPHTSGGKSDLGGEAHERVPVAQCFSSAGFSPARLRGYHDNFQR
jgi:hypothetical protein